MSELLPCPFCGGEINLSNGSDWTNMHCRECDVRVDFYIPLEQALTAWNRRTDAIPPDVCEAMLRANYMYVGDSAKVMAWLDAQG